MASKKKTTKKKKTKSRVNEAGNYTKPAMRKRMFQRIKAGNASACIQESRWGL